VVFPDVFLRHAIKVVSPDNSSATDESCMYLGFVGGVWTQTSSLQQCVHLLLVKNFSTSNVPFLRQLAFSTFSVKLSRFFCLWKGFTSRHVSSVPMSCKVRSKELLSQSLYMN
jgi:hypothetical protein